ncbi:MAG: 3'(2'),5'-bisphosphate nucleotidase CysQ [Nannocystaceae bacterium]
MDLKHELDFALELAERCGAIALELQRQGPDALCTREKTGDDGPVTRADTEINSVIVGALRATFPGDAIVAEESAESSHAVRQAAPRCWFIDPIDGTTEYARGEDSWAIHIGLCVDGEPTLGVVHEGARGRTSWGIGRGEGAGAWGRRAGGEPFPLRPGGGALDRLRMVSSKSHASPRITAVMEALAIPPERNLRIGSLGVKLMTIAWGEADVYVHPRSGTKLWDTCAPEAVLRAAGGVTTDLRGAPLRYRDPTVHNLAGIVSTRGDVNLDILARLLPLTSTWELS